MKVLKVTITAEFPVIASDAFDEAEAVRDVEARIIRAQSELTTEESAGPRARGAGYVAKMVNQREPKTV